MALEGRMGRRRGMRVVGERVEGMRGGSMGVKGGRVG